MSLESEFHAALVESYRQAGELLGYWPRRFLQAVKRHGGVATAKRMLTPRTKGQRAGLDRLIDGGNQKLTLEWIVLQDRFAPLFSAAELKVAADRLGDFVRIAKRVRDSRQRLFPDELEPGVKYAEGARRQVRVNAYERDSRARDACIAHYGPVCMVCDLQFERVYGAIGAGFIHIHHLRPLALASGEYELDPIADLRPVCPNCHAMLHRCESVLGIEELKQRMKERQGQPGATDNPDDAQRLRENH